MDFLFEAGLQRFVGHIDAIALDVELPAMIHTAKPAFLVATQEQRRQPVRAELIEQADSSFGIAEGDEIFAQELYPFGRAIRLRKFLREQGGKPIPEHDFAHWSTRSHARQQFVFFFCQHEAFPSYTAHQKSREILHLAIPKGSKSVKFAGPSHGVSVQGFGETRGGVGKRSRPLRSAIEAPKSILCLTS